MPALTSYSPYETLVFFQNVVQYGADISSLQDISSALTQNQLIRDSNDYDASKFSPDALQHLYDRTINAQKEGSSDGVNGDVPVENGNPRKRKLSTSPAPKQNQDAEQLLQELVNTLYASFKDETIKELRQQEQEYERLQGDIGKLEEDVKTEQANAEQPAAAPDQTTNVPQTPLAHAEHRADEVSAQLQASLEAVNNSAKPSPQPPPIQPQVQHQPSLPPLYDRAQQSPVPSHSTPAPRSASGTPHAHHAPPPQLPLPAQHTSPGAFNRTLPPPSPQRGSHGPLPPPPHAYPHHPQGHAQPPMLPPIHSLQRMPSYEGYPPHQRAPSQGHGSPMPQQPQQAYPMYQQYPQPPPHGWHSPVPQQYQQPQYNAPPHHPPQPPTRYPQVHTPNQPPYQPYPHTAPVPYPNQQQWPRPPPQQYHQYPMSAGTTPVPRSGSRTSVVRSASSTPWKSRNTPVQFRARSPSRLDREVSPLSDDGSPPPESPKRTMDRQAENDQNAARKMAPREKSATPAADLSRSQSVVSNVSEALDPPKRKAGRPSKIKAEPPSTPAPMISDTEQQQRSSGRRGRVRTGTITNKPELTRPTTTTKRKREAPSASPAPALQSSSHFQPTSPNIDSDFVIVSKTFGRTSHHLLNEITSHKHAGIFAKPLSERDAPGYKSLVHRPQDLKSIKAAINKGSRAAIIAIEELETKGGDEEDITTVEDSQATPTPTPKPTASSTNAGGERPIGNGFYLIRKNEDLVPPKGIVNSSQLEMELVRMFANAVMFNPLPSSERGFGRSLRLRKRGGELRAYGARKTAADEDNEEASAEEIARGESEPATTSSTAGESDVSGPSADEDGIIADAREMFEDVEYQVAKWKEVEGDRLSYGPIGAGSFSTPMVGPERHASVSASSVVGGHEPEEDDGHERDSTPAPSMVGSMRKRRRVGDH
ncbi:hypothetical protein H2198_005788 [Neophaeococcomyces mojaviensis]|uniref:Uncharacterized protein n=1 Tax=Neophaeococcomyces mojaviensis TaxID=3383035 RepID=A0ACC3A5I8_9EURO|nr:hypothetical protein H2198_005788 [Knufia sp. JES_112]